MPSPDTEKPEVALYPGHFVDTDNTLLKNIHVYTDVPGDNEVSVTNHIKVGDNGRGGKLLPNTEYNFWWTKEEKQKSWLNDNLTEDDFTKLKTGAASNGVLEVKLPKLPTFEIKINDSDKPEAQYIGWAPAPCKVKMKTGEYQAKVTLRVKDGSKAKLSFYEKETSGALKAATDTIELTVPKGGEVEFFMGGKYPNASENKEDTEVEVVAQGSAVHAHKLMVRIRKNANDLTDDERRRYLQALKTINTSGEFQKLRDLHEKDTMSQAHFSLGFLSWHRGFTLDLERHLQKADPSVCLHYWRFDQASPKVFTAEFMGKFESGALQFASGHPLKNWNIDSGKGIERRPRPGIGFDTDKAPPGIEAESATLGKGSDHAGFSQMERSPHGTAHTRWQGFIDSIPTAAKDPLFFMLHCNVDRLWAKWQSSNKARFDADSTAIAYPGGIRIGHGKDDTLWPWNGDNSRLDYSRVETSDRAKQFEGSPRPARTFPPSECTKAPEGPPKVSDMFDYQGRHDLTKRLGFDYDDVPFAP